ncbi:MAG TPA: response regulator [Gaiellaceae bacterium]|nr:response regulator [Gaiellaceae bacterium]HWB21757.1 response regulator [Gaiellaceae bacterium]
MTDVPQEFLALFRDEANGRLDNMVDALLALEAGRAGPEAVEALFRDAHTIKGGAGMLGLAEMQTLAHAVEDVLDGAREAGEFPLDLADMLLRSIDALRMQLAGDAGGVTDLFAELEERRRSLLTETPAEEPVKLEREAAPPGRRAAIRVPAEKIDRLLDLVGESVLHRRRLEHVLADETEQSVSDELDLGERLLTELKDAAIGMRTLPLSSITGPMPRAVRDMALAEGKQAELRIVGLDTELDRVILESLADPLVHLLRNAVAHGIEAPEERERAGKPVTGLIELRALQKGGSVEVVVADDGRGVSPETLAEGARVGSLAEVLAAAGFSTAEEVTGLSGRGVGLDAVKRHVESFGGSLEVRSEPGQGTAVVLLLPLALALIEALLIERGGQTFGIPLASIEEVVIADDRLSLEGRPALNLREQAVPLIDLADLIGASANALPPHSPAIIISTAGRRIATLCDRLLGQDEVVVKPLGPLLISLHHRYLGAAILGDGRIALLLDPGSLVRAQSLPRARPEAPRQQPVAMLGPKVLVVEDSFTVRELQRSILEAAGYRVETARDGREGLDRLLADDEIELVLTDIEMPEMDGFELTRAIRANPERGSTPIVVLTSRNDEHDRRRGLEAGADAYMVKRSFDQHTLLDTVERLVGR